MPGAPPARFASSLQNTWDDIVGCRFFVGCVLAVPAVFSPACLRLEEAAWFCPDVHAYDFTACQLLLSHHCPGCA